MLLLLFGKDKNTNMWPFKKKIWKEVKREFLRKEYEFDRWNDCDIFNVFAVTYEDILSGETKIKEVWTLAE